MVEVFYTLIKKGVKPINDVPENLKIAVQKLLDKSVEIVESDSI